MAFQGKATACFSLRRFQNLQLHLQDKKTQYRTLMEIPHHLDAYRYYYFQKLYKKYLNGELKKVISSSIFLPIFTLTPKRATSTGYTCLCFPCQPMK